MNRESILILLGIFGVLSHCLLKASSLQSDAKAANLKFSLTDYFKSDYLGILLSFISVFAWYFLFEEVAVKYTSLQNFVRLSFFVMGLVGSYLIQFVASKAKKKIRTTVDVKTNELDDIKSGKDAGI
jgi:hypothetical protein